MPGIDLLKTIKKAQFEIPRLLMSDDIQSGDLTAEKLIRMINVHLDSAQQHRLLGFA